MYKSVIGAVCFFVSLSTSYAGPVVTKVSMNSDSFDRGSWHAISWDFVDIEDVESFDLSDPTSIIIPLGASRGRCAYQIGLQIPLPHEGSWKTKLLKDDPLFKGSSLPSLPFIGQSQNDPIGLQVLSAQGPWFNVGNDEVFASGDRLTVEVFVDGAGAGSYVDARSWLQCEWVTSLIFADGFESGTASSWN